MEEGGETLVPATEKRKVLLTSLFHKQAAAQRNRGPWEGEKETHKCCWAARTMGEAMMRVAGRAWYVSKPTSETSPRPVMTRRRRTEMNSYCKHGAGWRIFRKRLTDEQMLTASLSGELAGCDGS